MTGPDMAAPHGIPRPVTLLRFFDENGAAVSRLMTSTPHASAAAVLGTETAGGSTVCLARFYVMNENGDWLSTGEEMEF